MPGVILSSSCEEWLMSKIRHPPPVPWHYIPVSVRQACRRMVRLEGVTRRSRTRRKCVDFVKSKIRRCPVQPGIQSASKGDTSTLVCASWATVLATHCGTSSQRLLYCNPPGTVVCVGWCCRRAAGVACCGRSAPVLPSKL